MSMRSGPFDSLLEAAGEAQLHMRVEYGLCQIERYLAAYADFRAWCRAAGSPRDNGAEQSPDRSDVSKEE